MIGLSEHCTYYLCDVSVDMRKGFDGLSGLVTNHLGKNPLDRCAYVFINGARNRIKVLLWEGDGFSIYYKRLEKGTFDHPIVTKDGSDYQIKWDHFWSILRGIKWEKIEQKRRFQRG
ncbi:MAG: IS66 family insertion sequence element accessory protein TnpB [Saprospiraceae bacterium]